MLTLTHEAIEVNPITVAADITTAADHDSPCTGDIPVSIAVIDSSAQRRFERFCTEDHASIANALGWALGNHDLGREATDEAFARAFERWNTVDAMANPAGWVYRVGLNWGRRRIWRRNKERQLLETIDLSEHRDCYIDQDLAAALATLPIKFRSVVVLRHLLGYSERDTAEALGISPGTAKSRMSRGLERLRAHLEDAS